MTFAALTWAPWLICTLCSLPWINCRLLWHCFAESAMYVASACMSKVHTAPHGRQVICMFEQAQESEHSLTA